ncbi:MFS transporter, partial [Streptomyces anulatus]|nr:MFS transporter [Streptomyces anulatus]
AGALPPGPLPWLLAATAVLAGALLWVRRAAPAKPLPDAVPRTETDGSAPVSAHP